MKRSLATIFAVFVIFIAPFFADAHSGRTDSFGCHTCRTNCPSYGLAYGQYHCHNAPKAPNNNPSFQFSSPQPPPSSPCYSESAGTCDGKVYTKCEQITYDKCKKEAKFWQNHKSSIRGSVKELLGRVANDGDIEFYANYSRDINNVRALMMQSDEYKEYQEEKMNVQASVIDSSGSMAKDITLVLFGGFIFLVGYILIKRYRSAER